MEWLDRWPEAFRGVVLANEVLDALPVHRFRVRGGEINTLGVTWQLGRLDWSEVKADAALESAVRRIEAQLGERLPDGYASEINLRLPAWIAGLGAALQEGVALFIDYGLPQRQYYRVDRREGTLLCHFRHRFHDDPLILAGVQDIGAWVDFTAVAEAATAAGLGVAGYTTQAHFLIGNGIEKLLAPQEDGDLTGRLQLARQAMLLTLPGEMGERFKVIGLTRGFDTPLLEQHQAALWIASPVLKAVDGALPFLHAAQPLLAAWNRNRQRAYYLQGGRWPATPVSPPGLAYDSLYGRSANQERLIGSAASGLSADDWVFLRPAVSEGLLGAFGELQLLHGGRLVGRWAALPGG